MRTRFSDGSNSDTSIVSTLSAAALGATAGVLIAAAVACWLFPITVQWVPFQSELLRSHWGQFHPEPREIKLLAFTAVLGVLGAMIGSRRVLPPASLGWGIAIGALISVFVNLVISYALSVPDAAQPLAALAAIWTTGTWWILSKMGIAAPRTALPNLSLSCSYRRGPGSLWHEHVLPVCVLVVLLAPSSLQAVAARIGYEMHVASFLIGPALYSLIPGLVPGIDYFSQYSVGQPFLFSLMLGRSADATILRYVFLIVACMFAYYTAVYYFLRWLFQSWRWALWITLISLLLHFHTDRTFFDPSSYVLRHPLLIAVVATLAWWVRRGLDWKAGVVLGTLLSMSLFLNTETGVYQCLAVGAVAVFSAKSLLRGVVLSAAVTAVTLGLFTCACYAAFGPRVLSAEFLQKVFEPLWIYSGGYGSVPVDWAYRWHLLYNVIAPGLALATIGWGLPRLRSAQSPEDRSRTAALAATAALAIMVTAKYWNMSYVALWHVNALPFLAILGWWGREVLAVLRIEHTEPDQGGLRLQQTGTAILAMLAVALVAFAGDARNPTQYGLRAYLKYASAWSAPIRNRKAACRELNCAAPRLAREDVNLITSLTRPDERVAILDWIDWAYLIEAHRAPMFRFIPGFAMFTHTQINASISSLDLVFVAPGQDGRYVISPPELEEILRPELERNYVVAGRGARLVALKRIR